ncbi:MAG: DUF4125 family protein [Muribaculum sp.]|nr:DUF4125 family protein [Muribaculum sp.]
MEGRIDAAAVLQKVDAYYRQNQGQEAEQLMQDAIAEAVSLEDDESLLQLLNELLGYYREVSRVEDSYAIGGQCLALAERMGLAGSIPYATTLLNVANAYRAGGRLEDSLKLYLQVREIYDERLEPDDMLMASLENNLSLLYQEMGRFEEAKESLLRALGIVERQPGGVDFEVAVTHANLAASCLQTGEAEEARSYAEASLREFEAMGLEDAHYGAALSALATYYYQKKEYVRAQQLFERGMAVVERNLGRNAFYERLWENAEACRTAQEAVNAAAQGAERTPKADARTAGSLHGMDICRAFYEQCGRPMIAERFPEYEGKIAVGLAGKGSDCFGYDDVWSRDHDWGPEFCMWVTDETYAQIGEALQEAYDSLPEEFQGYRRMNRRARRARRGVFTVSEFFRRALDASCYEQVRWQETPDYALAAVSNGVVFRDDEGVFTAEREKFWRGYPERIRYLKLADSAAKFSQAGQYNYGRMLKRGDGVTAQVMLADCAREAMKLQHYIENRYPPHDKWLYRSLQESEKGRELACLLTGLPDAVEEIGAFFAGELYGMNLISDSDAYLDAHSAELAAKAEWAECGVEELAKQIARVEFAAFDKVKNVGGRASCQNDWPTFSIMRESQYLTWNRVMLMQYLYDFNRELSMGHNLIEEKYGRMMESTAPEEYASMRERFPEISPEKKAIIEQIVGMQVAWMEEFAQTYPALADNARSVHTSEDNIGNTSYETYLRGEISTYSDKMLELYGRYVVEYARRGENLTFAIMANSVRLYGYESLEAAERFLE